MPIVKCIQFDSPILDIGADMTLWHDPFFDFEHGFFWNVFEVGFIALLRVHFACLYSKEDLLNRPAILYI